MKETECGVMFRNKDKHYLSYKDKYFKSKTVIVKPVLNRVFVIVRVTYCQKG